MSKKWLFIILGIVLVPQVLLGLYLAFSFLNPTAVSDPIELAPVVHTVSQETVSSLLQWYHNLRAVAYLMAFCFVITCLFRWKDLRAGVWKWFLSLAQDQGFQIADSLHGFAEIPVRGRKPFPWIWIFLGGAVLFYVLSWGVFIWAILHGIDFLPNAGMEVVTPIHGDVHRSFGERFMVFLPFLIIGSIIICGSKKIRSGEFQKALIGSGVHILQRTGRVTGVQQKLTPQGMRYARVISYTVPARKHDRQLQINSQQWSEHPPKLGETCAILIDVWQDGPIVVKGNGWQEECPDPDDLEQNVRRSPSGLGIWFVYIFFTVWFSVLIWAIFIRN